MATASSSPRSPPLYPLFFFCLIFFLSLLHLELYSIYPPLFESNPDVVDLVPAPRFARDSDLRAPVFYEKLGSHELTTEELRVREEVEMARIAEDEGGRERSERTLKYAQREESEVGGEEVVTSVEEVEWRLRNTNFRESFPWKIPDIPIYKNSETFAYLTYCIPKKDDDKFVDSYCLPSLCSVLKFTEAKNVYVIVNRKAKERMGDLLEVNQVHPILTPDEEVWPSSRAHPASSRFFTFYKLLGWRMEGYEKVLWFDPDVMFRRNATEKIVRKFTPFAATKFNFPVSTTKKDRRAYFNAGVMLLQPSLQTFEFLKAKWIEGDFSVWKSRTHGRVPSDQDLLIEVFSHRGLFGGLKQMTKCENVKLSAKGDDEEAVGCPEPDRVLYHGGLWTRDPLWAHVGRKLESKFARGVCRKRRIGDRGKLTWVRGSD